MKKICLLFSIFIFITNIDAKEIKTNLDGILATGGQMGNMRDILALYTMVGAGITYKSPKESLKKNIALYELELDCLEKNFKSKEIQEYVLASRKAWGPLKAKILTAFESSDEKTMREVAKFIHDNIRTVIVQQIKMKSFFLKNIPEQERELINAAIEIGASIKRLSAHYMMKMWKLNDPTIEKHWDKGVAIYTNSILVLEKSDLYKDPSFKKLLDQSKKSLHFFKIIWKFNNKSMPVLIDQRGKSEYKNAKNILKAVLEYTSK